MRYGLQSSKISLVSTSGNIFFQSQLFTITDQKADSFSLVQIQKHFLLLLLAVGHTNYPLVIDYVDTGLCSFSYVALSSHSRPLPRRPSPPIPPAHHKPCLAGARPCSDERVSLPSSSLRLRALPTPLPFLERAASG